MEQTISRTFGRMFHPFSNHHFIPITHLPNEDGQKMDKGVQISKSSIHTYSTYLVCTLW